MRTTPLTTNNLHTSPARSRTNHDGNSVATSRSNPRPRGDVGRMAGEEANHQHSHNILFSPPRTTLLTPHTPRSDPILFHSRPVGRAQSTPKPRPSPLSFGGKEDNASIATPHSVHQQPVTTSPVTFTAEQYMHALISPATTTTPVAPGGVEQHYSAARNHKITLKGKAQGSSSPAAMNANKLSANKAAKQAVMARAKASNAAAMARYAGPTVATHIRQKEQQNQHQQHGQQPVHSPAPPSLRPLSSTMKDHHSHHSSTSGSGSSSSVTTRDTRSSGRTPSLQSLKPRGGELGIKLYDDNLFEIMNAMETPNEANAKANYFTSHFQKPSGSTTNYRQQSSQSVLMMSLGSVSIDPLADIPNNDISHKYQSTNHTHFKQENGMEYSTIAASSPVIQRPVESSSPSMSTKLNQALVHIPSIDRDDLHSQENNSSQSIWINPSFSTSIIHQSYSQKAVPTAVSTHKQMLQQHYYPMTTSMKVKSFEMDLSSVAPDAIENHIVDADEVSFQASLDGSINMKTFQPYQPLSSSLVQKSQKDMLRTSWKPSAPVIVPRQATTSFYPTTTATTANTAVATTTSNIDLNIDDCSRVEFPPSCSLHNLSGSFVSTFDNESMKSSVSSYSSFTRESFSHRSTQNILDMAMINGNSSARVSAVSRSNPMVSNVLSDTTTMSGMPFSETMHADPEFPATAEPSQFMASMISRNNNSYDMNNSSWARSMVENLHTMAPTISDAPSRPGMPPLRRSSSNPTKEPSMTIIDSSTIMNAAMWTRMNAPTPIPIDRQNTLPDSSLLEDMEIYDDSHLHPMSKDVDGEDVYGGYSSSLGLSRLQRSESDRTNQTILNTGVLFTSSYSAQNYSLNSPKVVEVSGNMSSLQNHSAGIEFISPSVDPLMSYLSPGSQTMTETMDRHIFLHSRSRSRSQSMEESGSEKIVLDSVVNERRTNRPLFTPSQQSPQSTTYDMSTLTQEPSPASHHMMIFDRQQLLHTPSLSPKQPINQQNNLHTVMEEDEEDHLKTPFFEFQKHQRQHPQGEEEEDQDDAMMFYTTALHNHHESPQIHRIENRDVVNTDDDSEDNSYDEDEDDNVNDAFVAEDGDDDQEEGEEGQINGKEVNEFDAFYDPSHNTFHATSMMLDISEEDQKSSSKHQQIQDEEQQQQQEEPQEESMTLPMKLMNSFDFEPRAVHSSNPLLSSPTAGAGLNSIPTRHSKKSTTFQAIEEQQITGRSISHPIPPAHPFSITMSSSFDHVIRLSNKPRAPSVSPFEHSNNLTISTILPVPDDGEEEDLLDGTLGGNHLISPATIFTMRKAVAVADEQEEEEDSSSSFIAMMNNNHHYHHHNMTVEESNQRFQQVMSALPIPPPIDITPRYNNYNQQTVPPLPPQTITPRATTTAFATDNTLPQPSQISNNKKMVLSRALLGMDHMGLLSTDDSSVVSGTSSSTTTYYSSSLEELLKLNNTTQSSQSSSLSSNTREAVSIIFFFL